MDDTADGPTFRANKRRKVFRKRAGSDTNTDQPHVATSPRPDQEPLVNENSSATNGEEESSSRPDIARVRRTKKHGMAFSSSDRTSSRPQNDNEETALVVSEPQVVEQQNGRFTKQTGKTIVEDDKHMSAYIDSKLAELRYGSSTPNNTSTTKQQLSHVPAGQPQDSVQAHLSPNRDSAPLSPQQPPPTQQQPNPSKPQPPSTRHKRRGPRPPSPSTTARASLIDQILRESNHTPHYTPSTSNSSSTTKGSNTTTLDPDAAAAEAFKADFLAQAEARNLSRRQPAANASTAAAASSGPKLGGSRAARERMRVAEEAKGKK